MRFWGVSRIRKSHGEFSWVGFFQDVPGKSLIFHAFMKYSNPQNNMGSRFQPLYTANNQDFCFGGSSEHDCKAIRCHELYPYRGSNGNRT